MKIIGRVVFVLLWLVVVYAVLAYDSAREASKKRQMGRNYEGPLEDAL